jgi:hypothetical protein
MSAQSSAGCQAIGESRIGWKQSSNQILDRNQEQAMDDPTYTIQRTSKKIKGAKAIGWVLLWFSLYDLLVNHDPLGGLWFWIAVIVIAIARMAKWWNHE